MNRRSFISTLIAATAVAAEKRSPRILLRSAWQTVNIGDIGHTPGVLAILELLLPEAEVWLWPGDVGDGVKEMLAARFPKLRFAQSAEDLKLAFEECDFLLHGSGPSLVGQKHVAQWVVKTRKPYGVYGITLPSCDAECKALLTGARFVFFRDSKSLEAAKNHGVECPVMEVGQDGAFAVDLRDDAKAAAFLEAHDLKDGQFLCCIPRYRRTPYWLIPKKKALRNEEYVAFNEKMKEHDHAPHREAIVRVIRETALKVLICPEDQTQMALGKEMLFDKLPDDVKPRVVLRENYWLTNEAVSTYVRSAGLFGNEMHSPIMAVGNGIPAIVCRWESQTTKGFMWRDIGLGEWLFDFDNEDEVRRLPAAVLAMAKDPTGAKAKAGKARAFVQQRQWETVAELRKQLGL